MKRFLSASFLLILICLIVAGCATRRVIYPNNQYIQERWVNAVQMTPASWARGTDRWFRSGDPNGAELAHRTAPYSAAISTMMVKVPNFNNIKVNGDFQVQIFGTSDKNSVFVYGPNMGVRSLKVEVRNNILCVTQLDDASPGLMRSVIIRIGVNDLKKLTHLGAGTVEGIQLRSTGLSVYSYGRGNMYLAGWLPLMRVGSAGSGCVTLFGVISRRLQIISKGSGAINLVGDISIQSIIHLGQGDINVIGVSDKNCPMKIYAAGAGKISLSGRSNIREIIAKGHTCVFARITANHNLSVYTYDNAQVGLSGIARRLVVVTKNGSCFYGRYLCAYNAYVRACDYSHINVTVANQVFAAATQNASVYLFGAPRNMSQFISDNGMVMPILGASCPDCRILRVRSVRMVRTVNVNSLKGEG